MIFNQKLVVVLSKNLFVFQFLFVNTAIIQPAFSQLPGSIGRRDVNSTYTYSIKKAVHSLIKRPKNNQRLFQVSLQLTESSDHFCNGAIVESNFVLTTADCALRFPLHWFKLRFGMNKNMVDGYTATPNHIFVHEKYDSKNLSNNIALIHTNDSLAFYQHGVLSVALPNTKNGDLPVGEKLTISGWCLLQTNDSDNFENVFQFANVNLISRGNCSLLYQDRKNINSHVICTKNENSFHCLGSSGTPAVNKYSILVGLLSGDSQQTTGLPFVFTEIRHYIEWIREQINSFLLVHTKLQIMVKSEVTKQKSHNKKLIEKPLQNLLTKTEINQNFQNQHDFKNLAKENLLESKLFETVSNLSDFSNYPTNLANFEKKTTNAYYYNANFVYLNIICILMTICIFSFVCFLSKKRQLNYRNKYTLKNELKHKGKEKVKLEKINNKNFEQNKTHHNSTTDVLHGILVKKI